MHNKCEYSGKVVDVSAWPLLAGDGDMGKTGEKNGLTVSKWKCPCGKSVDVKPVAGTTGTVRWHDVSSKAGTAGEGRKAGTQPATGAIATLAVFLANVAGLFMAGDLAKAQEDAVDYAKRLTATVADRGETIARLTVELERCKADASKAHAGLIRGASMIPDATERELFTTALADAFTVPVPAGTVQAETDTVPAG